MGGLSLSTWSDSAVARLAIYLIWRVKTWGVASLPNFETFALPDRTRRRHRGRGIAYGYDRMARREDLERLIEKGRSEAAARRWLERHPTLHWWDAPRPRLGQKISPDAASLAPETQETRGAGPSRP